MFLTSKKLKIGLIASTLMFGGAFSVNAVAADAPAVLTAAQQTALTEAQASIDANILAGMSVAEAFAAVIANIGSTDIALVASLVAFTVAKDPSNLVTANAVIVAATSGDSDTDNIVLQQAVLNSAVQNSDISVIDATSTIIASSGNVNFIAAGNSDNANNSNSSFGQNQGSGGGGGSSPAA